MSALAKSLMGCFVLCFTMVTSLAFAVKIDLATYISYKEVEVSLLAETEFAQ